MTLAIDPADVIATSDMTPEQEERETDSVVAVVKLALARTTTPTEALRLLVLSVADLAEQADRTADVITAAIALLREWRDGPGLARAAFAGDTSRVEMALERMGAEHEPPADSVERRARPRRLRFGRRTHGGVMNRFIVSEADLEGIGQLPDAIVGGAVMALHMVAMRAAGDNTAEAFAILLTALAAFASRSDSELMLLENASSMLAEAFKMAKARVAS